MSVPPGAHHCKDHQSNTSHYDKHNCEQCRAEKEVDRQKELLAATEHEIREHLLKADCETLDEVIETLLHLIRERDDLQQRLDKRIAREPGLIAAAEAVAVTEANMKAIEELKVARAELDGVVEEVKDLYEPDLTTADVIRKLRTEVERQKRRADGLQELLHAAEQIENSRALRKKFEEKYPADEFANTEENDGD